MVGVWSCDKMTGGTWKVENHRLRQQERGSAITHLKRSSSTAKTRPNRITLRPKHLLRTLNKLGFPFLALDCSSSWSHSLKHTVNHQRVQGHFCSGHYYTDSFSENILLLLVLWRSETALRLDQDWVMSARKGSSNWWQGQKDYAILQRRSAEGLAM